MGDVKNLKKYTRKLAQLAKTDLTTEVNNPDASVRIYVGTRSNDKTALTWLANDTHPYVQLAVANNRATPKEGLAILAKSTNLNILKLVSRHPNTSGETLTQLAGGENIGVRLNICKHPNTDAETLTFIANKPNISTDQNIAGHPNATASLLNILINERESCTNIAVRNKNVSKETLTKLVTNPNTDESVLTAIVNSEHTPVTILKQLSAHNIKGIREHVERRRKKQIQTHIDTLAEKETKYAKLLEPTFTGWENELETVIKNLTKTREQNLNIGM